MLNLNEMLRFDPLNDNPEILPDKMGLYFICIKDKNKLPEIMNDVTFIKSYGLSTILYIGISSKQGLRRRDYKNHFTGSARNSTLRKSIGSLFEWKQDRIQLNPSKKCKYMFTKEKETKLSMWMKENLIMFYFILDANVNKLEVQLINEISPPLNLRDNKSPINYDFRKKLLELRN